ncbi:unnamed protein product, partial [Symbiodinium necroappetens]
WVEEGDWLVLPEGTPFEPELEKCLERADLTLAEIQAGAACSTQFSFAMSIGLIDAGQLPRRKELQLVGRRSLWLLSRRRVMYVLFAEVEAWQQMWKIQSMNRMWTSADVAHVHAISGAIYFALGAGVLLYTCASDIMTLNGNSWALTSESAVAWVRSCQSYTEFAAQAPTLPMEASACTTLMLPRAVSETPGRHDMRLYLLLDLGHFQVKLLALFAGVLNALSGLQPSLLGSPGPRRSDVLKVLGFGSRGDVLAYQTARAVWPELAIADPLVGGLTLLLVAHQVGAGSQKSREEEDSPMLWGRPS